MLMMLKLHKLKSQRLKISDGQRVNHSTLDQDLDLREFYKLMETLTSKSTHTSRMKKDNNGSSMNRKIKSKMLPKETITSKSRIKAIKMISELIKSTNQCGTTCSKLKVLSLLM